MSRLSDYQFEEEERARAEAAKLYPATRDGAAKLLKRVDNLRAIPEDSVAHVVAVSAVLKALAIHGNKK